MKKLLTVALAVSLVAFGAPSQAQILGGANGDAAGLVEYGCSGCCYVVNKSQKRIRATMALALGASVTQTIFPGDRKTFSLGQGCVTSAFGLFVDFIPDGQ